MINIAIDGHASSGKSTIAKQLAKKLGFKVFDTGALYRGFACAFDYMKLDENQICEDYVESFIKKIKIKVEFEGDIQRVIVNGVDHTENLRTEKTSILTPKLSSFLCVRNKILKLQRDYGKKHDIVMEGRDIGSYVLPDADFKFFCTADINVRAMRRYNQQKAMGNVVDFDSILEEMKERDYRDTYRDHGALKIMADSIVVDTTNQTLEQSVEFCMKKIVQKYPKFAK